jgi:hypothetical protein
MNNDIQISEETYDELFKSFRKQKLVVARPESISITRTSNAWKVSLSLSPGTYRKASTYMTYKPLFKFIKDRINLTKDVSPLHWEIVRN